MSAPVLRCCHAAARCCCLLGSRAAMVAVMQHSRRCCYAKCRRCLPRAGSCCNQLFSQQCRQLEVLSQRYMQLYKLHLSQPCSTQPVRHLLSTCACRQLYEVLSQPALARRRTPVLLACNKQVQGRAEGQGLSMQGLGARRTYLVSCCPSMQQWLESQQDGPALACLLRCRTWAARRTQWTSSASGWSGSWTRCAALASLPCAACVCWLLHAPRLLRKKWREQDRDRLCCPVLLCKGSAQPWQPLEG